MIVLPPLNFSLHLYCWSALFLILHFNFHRETLCRRHFFLWPSHNADLTWIRRFMGFSTCRMLWIHGLRFHSLQQLVILADTEQPAAPSFCKHLRYRLAKPLLCWSQKHGVTAIAHELAHFLYCRLELMTWPVCSERWWLFLLAMWWSTIPVHSGHVLHIDHWRDQYCS